MQEPSGRFLENQKPKFKIQKSNSGLKAYFCRLKNSYRQ
jgi:hypothetical protein